MGSLLAERLSSLPKDEHGRPVPFISSWTGGPWRSTDPDPEWGWVQCCNCVQGDGIARPGEMCYDRQRRAISGRLCQMCGQGFDGEPFCFLTTERTIRHRDPAWHAACGRWAFSVCPGLLRIRTAGDQELRGRVLVARCESYGVEAHLDGPSVPRDDLPAVSEWVGAARSRELASERVAVRWLYALPDSPVTCPVEEWLKLARPVP